MDHAESIRALQSVDVGERLSAARYLALNATSVDYALISEALSKEKVRWVKVALERAVERTTVEPAENKIVAEHDLLLSSSNEDQAFLELKKALHLNAVQEATGTILHEIAPVVGMIKLAAIDEVENYDASETKKALDRLSMLIEAVRQLKSAVAPPNIADYDLKAVVEECVSFLPERMQPVIRTAGPASFFVKADKHRITLALTNGLKNAVEANWAGPEPERAVVVNWGNAGKEFWIAVIDCGPGFSGDPSAAIATGVSTKAEHIGFGLMVAQSAMRAMEGDIYLTNGVERGARFEVRWFKADENATR